MKRRSPLSCPRLLIGLAALLLPITPAYAQEAAPEASLGLELNALQDSDAGCKVSFVVTNNLGSTLNLATTELALFDTDGAIARIVRLDFKDLIEGKSKILQFNISELKCESVGRILVNDITACNGEGIAAGSCLADLRTSAIPAVRFGI